MNAEQISQLFTRPAAVSIATPAMYDGRLYPEEEAIVARAITRRRREFAAGRSCARVALGRLGAPAGPILADANRAPVWPSGYVGSISHCEGFCCAVAARSDDITSLGIDAEDAGSLTPGAMRVVLRPDEIARLGALPDPPGSSWAKLAFSAKEAVYKGCYPLTKVRLDFHDVSIRFSIDGGFEAIVELPGQAAARPIHVPDGRWRVGENRVYAAVTLTDEIPPAP